MNDIDNYLSELPPDQCKHLTHICNLIREMVPDASETMSYGMPTFKYKGKSLIHFAAFKNHMSIFPTADPGVVSIGKKLEKFRTSKGTLQFTDANVIPDELVKAIVTVRIKSIEQ